MSNIQLGLTKCYLLMLHMCLSQAFQIQYVLDYCFHIFNPRPLPYPVPPLLKGTFQRMSLPRSHLLLPTSSRSSRLVLKAILFLLSSLDGGNHGVLACAFTSPILLPESSIQAQT